MKSLVVRTVTVYHQGSIHDYHYIYRVALWNCLNLLSRYVLLWSYSQLLNHTRDLYLFGYLLLAISMFTKALFSLLFYLRSPWMVISLRTTSTRYCFDDSCNHSSFKYSEVFSRSLRMPVKLLFYVFSQARAQMYDPLTSVATLSCFAIIYYMILNRL